MRTLMRSSLILLFSLLVGCTRSGVLDVPGDHNVGNVDDSVVSILDVPPLTGVALVPNKTSYVDNVVTVPAALSPHETVDDGSLLSSADYSGTYVRPAKGVESASVTFGFSGPTGPFSTVQLNGLVHAGGSSQATVQFLLFDRESLIGTSRAFPLEAAWSNFSETFEALSVAAGSHLEVKAIFRNPGEGGLPRLTQLWLVARPQPSPSCVPAVCDTTPRRCGTVEDGCGGQLSCGVCGPTEACSATTHTCLPSSPVVAAVGDIAGTWAEDEATAQLIDTLRPTAILTLGDNVYATGTATEFNDHFKPTWGRHLARIRPVPGNHEHATASLAGYCGYFGSSAQCNNGYSYYSYNIGAWHLIALDSGCSSPSTCADPMVAGSAMRQWLSADLKANKAKCTLAYWHHPRFNSGPYGNDVRSASLWQELYDAGVELVLNGHEHDYERFGPQSPSGTADNARGIVQFVVGTGGAPLRAFGTPQPNSSTRNPSAHGVLKLTLHPESFDYEFLPIRGQTYTDKGSVACH